MQRTDIRLWFGDKKENEKPRDRVSSKIPSFFHLESPSQRAKWLDKIPNNSVRIGTFQWRYEKDRIKKVVLSCSRSCYELIDRDRRFTITREYYKFNERDLSLLKSQFQKCTRRQKDLLGLRTAISMILIEDENKRVKQIGLFELLRRFSIIIIEDSILNVWYPNIIWFLSALTKGVKLGQEFVLAILKIINITLKSDWQDKSFRHISPDKKLQYKGLISNIDIDKGIKSLLWSLYFRTSYKGMYGDTNMLYKSILLWLDRINKGSDFVTFLELDPTLKDNDEHYLNLRPLDPENILLESIDFHCTNICDRVLEYIDYEKVKVKELIWNFRSSINSRMDIEPIKNKDLYKKPRDEEMWITIKNIVDNESKKIKLEKFSKMI